MPPREVVGRRVAPGSGPSRDFTYSVVEPTGPARAGGERRGERRIASHLREANASEARGRPIVDCRIRNLSRGGARLQLDHERPLPRSFMLREPGTGRCFLARLIWQRGRDAGVKLVSVDG